jgi:hypothetical protein
LATVATAIAVVGAGCGQRSGDRLTLDGVYRATVGADALIAIAAPDETPPTRGAWTLVLDHGRFAITQDGADQGCAWAYGALELGGRNRMTWTIIDAGAVPAGVVSNQPGDRYRFTWSRYRDVLILSAAPGGAAGYFAARPWRRTAQAPVVRDLSARCPPPPGALRPTGAEHARPSPDVALSFTGDLVRTTPTTWDGDGTAAELGRGRLTIRGGIVFSRDGLRRRMTFAVRFAQGTLRGCGIASITRRPHGRYLWQGDGQVTDTSRRLRAYRGLAVTIGGLTTIDAITRMHGGLRSSLRPPSGSVTAPRDLC